MKLNQAQILTFIISLLVILAFLIVVSRVHAQIVNGFDHNGNWVGDSLAAKASRLTSHDPHANDVPLHPIVNPKLNPTPLVTPVPTKQSLKQISKLSSGITPVIKLAEPLALAGVYDVPTQQDEHHVPILNQAILNNPNVTGIVLSQTWNDLEPGDANIVSYYNLDSLITQVTQANKQFQLEITAGPNTPKSQYVQGYPITLSSNAFGSVPVPWDQPYLRNWMNFINILGKHYASNSNLTGIKFEGFQKLTDELMLSDKSQDNQQWFALGYSPSFVVSSISDILAEYHNDFPNTPIVAMLTPCGFPQTQITQDCNMAKTIIDQSISQVGKNYFKVQANNWSNGTSANSIDSSSIQGYRELVPLSDKLSDALANLKTSPEYVELFDADILDPANATLLTRLNALK